MQTQSTPIIPKPNVLEDQLFNQGATLDDIVTPELLVKQYSDRLTTAQLNWQMRHRHTNGLSKAGAVLRVNRRLYIDVKKYTHWFLSQKA